MGKKWGQGNSEGQHEIHMISINAWLFLTVYYLGQAHKDFNSHYCL